MNYGRKILPIFVLIGALAAVFALVPLENANAAPIVSLSVSPSSVTSATAPIDFSWSASDPSGWCCYYYYQTYNYSNGAYSSWNYLGTVTSSRNTLADFGYTQYGTYSFRISAGSWTGVWNYGYSEWKNISFLPPPPSNISLRIDPSPGVITQGENATFSWSATNANEYWLFNNTTGTWEFLGNAAGSFTRSSSGSPIGQHWFYAGAYNRPNPTWVSGQWTGLGILNHTLTKETINGSQPCSYQPSAANNFQLGERAYVFTAYPQNPGTYTLQYRYFRPDGTIEKDVSLTGNYCYYYSSVDLTNSSHLGTWRVEMLINGRGSASQTFSVTMPTPVVPANFSFNPSSGIQGYTATASWSASSYAERYEYYAPAIGVNAWTSIGNVTSIPLNTATFSPNTYTVSLRACNSSGCSGSANAAFTVQQPAPVAPTASISPTAITTLQSATFSWGSASNASACTVFINNVDNGAVSCGGGSQTFLGSNLGIGTHTGFIRACNTGGCVNSNTVTLTVTTAAPTSASISADRTTMNVGESFTLTYSGNNNPTSYRVYSCLGSGCAFTGYATVSVTSETLVRSLADTYRFQIEACNANGCSPRSNIVEIIVRQIAPTTASINASALSIQINEYTIFTFSGNNDPTYYKIYRCDGAICAPIFIVESVQNTMSLTYSDVGERRFQIQACNAAGCSALSQILTLNIHGRTPPFLSISRSPTGTVAGCGGIACEGFCWSDALPLLCKDNRIYHSNTKGGVGTASPFGILTTCSSDSDCSIADTFCSRNSHQCVFGSTRDDQSILIDIEGRLSFPIDSDIVLNIKLTNILSTPINSGVLSTRLINDQAGGINLADVSIPFTLAAGETKTIQVPFHTPSDYQTANAFRLYVEAIGGAISTKSIEGINFYNPAITIVCGERIVTGGICQNDVMYVGRPQARLCGTHDTRQCSSSERCVDHMCIAPTGFPANGSYDIPIVVYYTGSDSSEVERLRTSGSFVFEGMVDVARRAREWFLNEKRFWGTSDDFSVNWTVYDCGQNIYGRDDWVSEISQQLTLPMLLDRCGIPASPLVVYYRVASQADFSDDQALIGRYGLPVSAGLNFGNFILMGIFDDGFSRVGMQQTLGILIHETFHSWGMVDLHVYSRDAGAFYQWGSCFLYRSFWNLFDNLSETGNAHLCNLEAEIIGFKRTQ